MDEGRPISYMAIVIGCPVTSATGAQFGTVHHVLQIPDLDLFDGLSVKTHNGLRFVDRDQIAEMTTTVVRCSLSDAEASSLPAPKGSAAFEFDLERDDAHTLTARLGRYFGRPHWKRLDE